MRLEDRHHLARCRAAGGIQDGRNLHRMVTVIVDHRDAAGLAGLGETPLNTFESGERGLNHGIGYIHLERDGDSGECVLGIVGAEHRQLNAFNRARGTVVPLSDVHIEAHAA